MKTSTKLVAGAALLAGTAAAVRWQMRRWFAASPRSVRLRRLVGVELRRYEPIVVARTMVDGDLDGARSRLTRFLAGGNHRNEGLASLGLVTAMHGARSERMAAATPAIELSSRAHPEAERSLCVPLPEGRALASLPIPDDERVVLEELPARVVGVIRWHGASDDDTVRAHADELLEKLEGALYEVREGAVMTACYDPPSTLPALRRNEVWLEVIIAE